MCSGDEVNCAELIVTTKHVPGVAFVGLPNYRQLRKLWRRGHCVSLLLLRGVLLSPYGSTGTTWSTCRRSSTMTRFFVSSKTRGYTHPLMVVSKSYEASLSSHCTCPG